MSDGASCKRGYVAVVKFNLLIFIGRQYAVFNIFSPLILIYPSNHRHGSSTPDETSMVVVLIVNRLS